MDNTVLTINHLSKRYPVGKNQYFRKAKHYVRAVDDVSLTIKKGEILGLVGESGCGKTTIAKIILKLLDPSSGEIIFQNTDITLLSKKNFRPFRKGIQIVFQDPYASLNPRMKVGEILDEPLIVHTKLSMNERRKKIIQALTEVGLDESHIDSYPHEFSGGQRQRIGIARALIFKPQLLICDEPVSALDVSIQAQVLNLLKDLQEKYHTAMLFIAHNMSVVNFMCDRICVMYLGNIVETALKDELFDKPMHPYTQALMASIPLVEINKEKQRVLLEGDVPSPINPPSGCSFHPRCSYCTERCKNEKPVLKELKPESSHMIACHLIT